MMRKSAFLSMVMAAALAACGGGDSEDAFQTPGTGGGNNGAVTQIQLLTSSPQLSADGSDSVTITALALNSLNQYVSGANVLFSADSGALAVTVPTTSEDSGATATLTPGSDPSSRIITVRAQVGTISATVPVTVTGTRLTLDGPDAVGVSQSGTYTVTLTNASGTALSGRPVTVTSSRSNTLNPASLTTNGSGTATFNLTVANSGNDTLTVSALGETASKVVTVSADSFAFVAPAANAEVAINTPTPVTIRWTVNGVAQVGQNVNFATTRGAVNPASVLTNGQGEATVSLSSASAGGAVVSANSLSGSATRPVEFVSTSAATLDLQPSLFTIGTGNTSTLTATVRDAAGNLVKGKTVTFSLQDVTGGTLSTPTAVTDSQGSAKSVYTAGPVTSAANGVIITATVQGTPAATDTAALTVAGRQVFISIGTGNEIEEFTTAQYRLEYALQVTDSTGNGVANVPLSVTVKSERYGKGVRAYDDVAEAWGFGAGFSLCLDEDTNLNGVLDAGEDFNTSGFLEAGNIATVTPSNVTTDANGFATIYVVYPQEYAYWLSVRLTARTSVQGTEYERTARFTVPGSEDDFGSETSNPPGPVSPFGTQACNSPD